MKSRIKLAALALATVGALPVAARADEGNLGHYLPGTNASRIDEPRENDGFTYRNEFTYYYGDTVSERQRLTLGGFSLTHVKETAIVDTSVIQYATPWDLAGGHESVAVRIPYMWLDVKGNVQGGAKKNGMRTERTQGFGDIEFLPLILDWRYDDFIWGASFGIYAPTGEWDKFHLANPGKNYWTFEPGVSFSYLGRENGFELTAFAGLDFNTTNNDIDYRSGDALHLDVTIAEHFRALGGSFGVGGEAFAYDQIERDRFHGSNKIGKVSRLAASSYGIGPVVSYSRSLDKVDLTAELKWLPELGGGDRTQGDAIWLKLRFDF